MQKKYSYIGFSFVLLIFGIYVVPKVVKRFQKADLAYFYVNQTTKDEKRKVPPFSFTNQKGQMINNATFEGKVYVVEFFFTTCPTICPLMNVEMKSIQDEFYGHPEFGIASFSITPEMDTEQVLKAYAERKQITSRNWHLLSGQPESVVYRLANEGFKLYAGKSGSEAHGGFEHSGLFALIDKEGYIRSRYDAYGNPIMYYRALEENGFPNQITELKEDIKLLLNE